MVCRWQFMSRCFGGLKLTHLPFFLISRDKIIQAFSVILTPTYCSQCPVMHNVYVPHQLIRSSNFTSWQQLQFGVLWYLQSKGVGRWSYTTHHKWENRASFCKKGNMLSKEFEILESPPAPYWHLNYINLKIIEMQRSVESTHGGTYTIYSAYYILLYITHHKNRRI